MMGVLVCKNGVKPIDDDAEFLPSKEKQHSLLTPIIKHRMLKGWIAMGEGIKLFDISYL